MSKVTCYATDTRIDIALVAIQLHDVYTNGENPDLEYRRKNWLRVSVKYVRPNVC